MKQIPVRIRLRDYMESEDGWGHAEGRRVHQALLDTMEKHPGAQVFYISLEGVRRTDASFPRECVVELARRLRGQAGIVLTDASDPDLLENWDAAARRREQPLLVRGTKGEKPFHVLGPPLTEGMRPLFDIVAANVGITTSEAANRLHQSVPNVSNKMKTLWEAGYILRRERTAITGGIEFEYYLPE